MIYTIGHSTRKWEEFVKILKVYKIKAIADVRHFPSSKKFPWFCKENMEKALEKEDIKYFWIEELGGYRKGGYINHMKTEEFTKGIEKLLEITEKEENLAILCAELLWWRCHRRFISDFLVKKGIRVVHIWDENKREEHEYKKYIERRVWCDKKAKKLEKFLESKRE